MTAPRGASRALAASKLIAILATCALSVACDDGPTAPRNRAAPTPFPTPNIAGSWQGRYNPGHGNQFFLCGPETAATATFLQDGGHVTGTIRTSNTNLSESTVDGHVTGGQLRGTLTIQGTNVRVTGVASADHLTMKWNVLFCGMNTLDLHRQP